MKNRLFGIFSIIAITIMASAFCADAHSRVRFLDTRASRKFLTIGVRAGINQSGKNWTNTDRMNTWKTGFRVGVIANLNFSNFLSLQPGFYFNNKSYDSVVLNDDASWAKEHTRFYTFSIPMQVQFHFNIARNFRWNVGIAPVLTIGLGGNTTLSAIGQNISKYRYIGETSNPAEVRNQCVDFGFEFSTGFTIAKHYEIGVSYTCGCINTINDPDRLLKNIKGRNKEWSLFIGYNF